MLVNPEAVYQKAGEQQALFMEHLARLQQQEAALQEVRERAAAHRAGTSSHGVGQVLEEEVINPDAVAGLFGVGGGDVGTVGGGHDVAGGDGGLYVDTRRGADGPGDEAIDPDEIAAYFSTST